MADLYEHVTVVVRLVRIVGKHERQVVCHAYAVVEVVVAFDTTEHKACDPIVGAGPYCPFVGSECDHVGAGVRVRPRAGALEVDSSDLHDQGDTFLDCLTALFVLATEIEVGAMLSLGSTLAAGDSQFASVGRQPVGSEAEQSGFAILQADGYAVVGEVGTMDMQYAFGGRIVSAHQSPIDG